MTDADLDLAVRSILAAARVPGRWLDPHSGRDAGPDYQAAAERLRVELGVCGDRARADAARGLGPDLEAIDLGD